MESSPHIDSVGLCVYMYKVFVDLSRLWRSAIGCHRFGQGAHPPIGAKRLCKQLFEEANICLTSLNFGMEQKIPAAVLRIARCKQKRFSQAILREVLATQRDAFAQWGQQSCRISLAPAAFVNV
jgi:hypothetical protein